MRENLWSANAALLRKAYLSAGGDVRFALVTRAIQRHMDAGTSRVIDVGAGQGRQAIMLARLGHSVVALDSDAEMLKKARQAVRAEPADVQSRIDIVLADGQSASSVVDGHFDVACCHSVLMYEPDPSELLREICSLLKEGGLISTLSVNTDARAMRSGLQGKWREALDTIQAGTLVSDSYIPSFEHSQQTIESILKQHGANTLEWFGVGVFSDHIVGPIPADDPSELIEAEWLAGSTDPYRQVARCFHLLSRLHRQ